MNLNSSQAFDDGDVSLSNRHHPVSTANNQRPNRRPTRQQEQQQQPQQQQQQQQPPISPRLEPHQERIPSRDHNSRSSRSRPRKKLVGASTVGSTPSSQPQQQQQLALDPVRKDTIVQAKEMLRQGSIKRGEFLEILTGSFTKIAIDVAEDYASACKNIGAKVDTEETVSSLLHSRVLSLAQFVLSVRSLDMHM